MYIICILYNYYILYNMYIINYLVFFLEGQYEKKGRELYRKGFKTL